MDESRGATVVINKYLAELVGTFILVIVGSMTILSAGQMGLVMIPFGFGLGLLAAIFAVGHVSGGHFNPAVTLAMYLDGRTSLTDLVGYWVAQFAGGILASLILVIVSNREAVSQTATTFPALRLVIMSELILTTVFVLVILASTRTAPASAGLAISLTLVAVHFAGIPFSGASVNPARSFGPALVGASFGGLWVYLVFPLVGGVVAWGLWQLFAPGQEEEDGEEGDEDVTVPGEEAQPGGTGLPEPGEVPPVEPGD
ncbi:MAG: MIP/aquaporin family protein [Actinomycetota bacterium]